MNHTSACSILLFIAGDSISGGRFPGVCVVLQQWGCWALCVDVRTNVAGCAARTCGWILCCGTPATARSWFSWSPRSRPLLGLPAPPNWTEGWTPREKSAGRFPPILTCESEPLTACPPDTPWLARCAASESVNGAVTIRVTPGRVSEVSTDVCCWVDTAAVMKVTERESNTTVMMLVQRR